MPEAAPLALVRRDIDRNANKIKRVLMEPGIRKEVLGGISKDEKKAITAFISQNRENALKTKPKVRVIFLFYPSSVGHVSFSHFLHQIMSRIVVQRMRHGQSRQLCVSCVVDTF